jgi:hypothetical protein
VLLLINEAELVAVTVAYEPVVVEDDAEDDNVEEDDDPGPCALTAATAARTLATVLRENCIAALGWLIECFELTSVDVESTAS